ncbi:hypothetical protein GW17_00056371 [Ensete ventricosum]|nr:hypothetical protein GW17_00056371 [Ensete ventricosum]
MSTSKGSFAVLHRRRNEILSAPTDIYWADRRYLAVAAASAAASNHRQAHFLLSSPAVAVTVPCFPRQSIRCRYSAPSATCRRPWPLPTAASSVNHCHLQHRSICYSFEICQKRRSLFLLSSGILH